MRYNSLALSLEHALTGLLISSKLHIQRLLQDITPVKFYFLFHEKNVAVRQGDRQLDLHVLVLMSGNT